MKTCWNQFVGDAPPQPTVGPAVPSANMGPDSVRQLSPSDDQEASRAQCKAGSKRADGGVRQNTPDQTSVSHPDLIYTLLHPPHPPCFRGVFSSDPSYIAPPAGVNWDQFVGDAPPQPTVGPAVPSKNMGPNPLRQLSPSDDREASRTQSKAVSKRADGGVCQSSRSSKRSSTDRHRAWVRHRQVSSDSSSPTRRLSPPAKRSRFGSRYVPRGSSSSEGSARSPRTRLLRRSRSPVPRRRGPSPQVQG